MTRKQEIEQTLKREFSKDIRALARLEELFFNLSFVSGQFRGDRGGLGGYLEVLSGLKEKVFLVEDGLFFFFFFFFVVVVVIVIVIVFCYIDNLYNNRICKRI